MVKKVTLKQTPGYDLALVIVNYNGSFWLKKVLQSLRDIYLPQTKYRVQVVVVDNGSPESPEEVLAEFKKEPWLKTIFTGQNLGFAGGNNVALRECQDTSKYVMLINSDIEFLPGKSDLDLLLGYLKKNPQVGIVSPRLNLSNGELDAACHRGEPTPWAAVTYFSKLAKIFPRSKIFAQYHQSWKDLNTIHEVQAVSGAAMMIPSPLLTEVGLLDERFFMYAEDLDWCRRFREAGYQVIYDPEVLLIHHKNKSGIESKNVKVRKKTNRLFWTTMLQYYDKHYPDSHLLTRFFLRAFLFLKTGGT